MGSRESMVQYEYLSVCLRLGLNLYEVPGLTDLSRSMKTYTFGLGLDWMDTSGWY